VDKRSMISPRVTTFLDMVIVYTYKIMRILFWFNRLHKLSIKSPQNTYPNIHKLYGPCRIQLLDFTKTFMSNPSPNRTQND
ncbi:MAG: hypothetical protein CK547_06865, partial [Chitinophagaceae bacterium]